MKEVVAEGPAAQAGVQKEDKLISLAGAEIQDPTHLKSLVGRHLVGDEVELVLQRGEERKTLEVKLGEGPPPTPVPQVMPPMPKGAEPPPEKPAEKPASDEPK